MTVKDRPYAPTEAQVITCDAYWHDGKLQDVGDNVSDVAPKLGCPVMAVKYAGDAEAFAASFAGGRTFDAATIRFAAKPVEFEALPLSHPLNIRFSSVTTGALKSIVHSAGGTLRQRLKEHRLYSKQAALLHHLRLDDVELACSGLAKRRDPPPIRRFTLSSQW